MEHTYQTWRQEVSRKMVLRYGIWQTEIIRHTRERHGLTSARLHLNVYLEYTRETGELMYSIEASQLEFVAREDWSTHEACVARLEAMAPELCTYTGQHRWIGRCEAQVYAHLCTRLVQLTAQDLFPVTPPHGKTTPPPPKHERGRQGQRRTHHNHHLLLHRPPLPGV